MDILPGNSFYVNIANLTEKLVKIAWIYDCSIIVYFRSCIRNAADDRPCLTENKKRSRSNGPQPAGCMLFTTNCWSVGPSMLTHIMHAKNQTTKLIDIGETNYKCQIYRPSPQIFLNARPNREYVAWRLQFE